MHKQFSGRLAFITGGASGIGEQICRDFADGGGSVVVADIHSKAAIDLAASLPKGEAGQQHLGIRLDVSKKSQVESALSQVIKTYGRPAEEIVMCAGVEAEAPIKDTPEELFDQIMDVNFKGTFLVTQIFGGALIDANKSGSITNVSSILAWLNVPGKSVYCASEAAVTQFSSVAAKEWGPKGIKVNSVHPGLIETPMTKHAVGTDAWKTYEENSSLRRVGQPKDVSNVVMFLISNQNSYVTGGRIEVSGQGSF